MRLLFILRTKIYIFAAQLKKVKHIIIGAIWAIVLLYFAIVIMVNIPMVQRNIGERVAHALSEKLATKAYIGRVDVGFFNRIIIDDVNISDQANQKMLKASRISAKFSYLELMKGRISITSAQIFGLNANLYKRNAEAKPNFQFVLDSLASKDTTQHTPLNLAISSLIIRHGEVKWNQLDAPPKRTFDTKHLHLTGISSHIILNSLTDDSLALNVRTLSLKEASGLNLQSLSFKLNANRKELILKSFDATLPHSHLAIDNITATYQFNRKKIEPASLSFNGSIGESYITPSDFTSLYLPLKKVKRKVVLTSDFSGTSSSIRIKSFQLSVPQTGEKPLLHSPADIRLITNGSANGLPTSIRWAATVSQLMVNGEGLKLLAGRIPNAVGRMGSLQFKGTVGGYQSDIALKGALLSEAGNARLGIGKHGDNLTGRMETMGFNLRQILNDKKFGTVATNINIDGNIKRKLIKTKGTITRFDYNGYSYRNVTLDGQWFNGLFDGIFNINDKNIVAKVKGTLNTQVNKTSAKLTADIEHFAPAMLNLFKGKFANNTYSANIVADFTGRSLNTANGKLSVNRLSVHTPSIHYALDSLHLIAGTNSRGHFITMNSDFGHATIIGNFNYNTLAQSIENIIANKLPSITKLTSIKFHSVKNNDYTLKAVITKSDWAKAILGIPVELHDSLYITSQLDDKGKTLKADIFAPSVTYDNRHLKNVSIVLNTLNNRLNADIMLTQAEKNGIGSDYRIEASAGNDELSTILSIDNHARKQRLQGRLNANINFTQNAEGKAVADLDILPSQFNIGDTVLTVHPANVKYSDQHLVVDHFAITSGQQHVAINGSVSKSKDDSLTVDLKNVNVEYILDLVNFHSVSFSGFASGKAHVARLFDKPTIKGALQVDEFSFEKGALGTLYASANWDNQLGQINIEAVARDTINDPNSLVPERTIHVNGYVSPKNNDIDLAMKLSETRANFLGNLCASFLQDVDLVGNGDLRLWGDLSKLNLTGNVTAHGNVGVTALGTRYSTKNARVRLIENEIQFLNDTIYDKLGNMGILSGSLYHQHLSDMSYNIDVQANRMLAYDIDGSTGQTFYGKVFGTGTTSIKGGSGEVNIKVDFTPEKGSEIVYDVTSPEALDTQEFIRWSSRDTINNNPLAINLLSKNGEASIEDDEQAPDIPTNIHLYFLINATPDATVKLIMDKASGDYITLNGSGVLRANYYNKGGLDIFGNYMVDDGLYKLTIQNIIKRDFIFARGGTISFGGDPYAAQLQLKAQYPIASVSLSDLNIGRSFSSNNIRVNCLMNITGTPASPKVSFGLDMPTVGTDAKQMIYSLINSEEEMNQQVLYLLAVGRFYAQSSNNANADISTRTSLAMQSILSGQISQQINSVLGSVIKNNDWNLGANISTGDEGWNNAEYEGLLSGRLLNNRLLLNGQFGYRDNNNATTSFIGDFDLRYLIFPNGNFSIHVYNQTNDRYFTRNSLNTQGIGFILKKDFNSLRDLFSLGKRKKTETSNP